MAPNDPVDVNFSVSVLAANSNGSTSGDNCFGDQLTVSANTSSVSESALSESFRYDAVNREIELINPVTLSVYNLSGQELGKQTGIGLLSLNELSPDRMDDDCSGHISMDELKQCLEDEHARTHLALLGLEVQDTDQ